MSYPTFSATAPAAAAPAAARLAFIRRTYAHLGAAVLIFAVLEALLLNSSLAVPLTQTMLGGRYGWLIVIGLFVGVSWVADRWAQSSRSRGMQYLGLGLFVVAEVVVFCPLLVIATVYSGDAQVIQKAGLITAVLFGGLTAVVFLTRKDFSWLRNILVVGGFAAFGIVIVSIVFGFNLGTFFAGAMVALAAGYILYQTSNVLHHYGVDSHVAAALALFSSLALMFWYVLRILMDRR